MTGFVKIILEASFTAGLAALAVMLIRLAMKKAPKRWAYVLWAVVFFRCLCPFSVESGLSVFNAVNAIPERTAETETVEALSEAAENSEIENILPVQTDLNTYGYQTAAPIDTAYAPPVAVRTENVPEKKPVNKYAVMFGVWAFGASAMALYGIISYVLLMRKLRTAVKTEESVYESDRISTAFSAGFFPPKIYVPCGLFEEERKLIIAHERVHIKRLDYIIKPVAFLGLTVHWFNPLIWLAFAFMTKDMELSCDEAVLKIFGAGEKKAYSEALLRVSIKRSGLADSYNFLPLAFAETGIKGRVKNVLKYKKPTLVVTVLAAAVVISACVVLGTNAKEDNAVNSELVKNSDIEYVEFRRGVMNRITDVNGNNICLYDDRGEFGKASENSGVYYKRAFVEGDIYLNLNSSTVSFGDGSLNRLIMAVDMTEFKINSLEVFSEEGKNFLKAQFEFTLAEGAKLPTKDGLIRLGNEKEPRLLMVEGGGNDGVYVISAEYELQSSDDGQFAFMLNDFADVSVYINSELVKDEEKVYTPIPEGETDYALADGAKLCIAHAPDKNTSLDSTDERVYGIQYTSDTNGGDKSRSVWLGMRAKNNELNRQICLDFGNKKITGFSVEDIYATDLQFTAVIKVTLADGEEITVISPNEPNEKIRVLNGDKENEYLLYMTADYDREDVDEYAIDFYGFDNITPQINTAFSQTVEVAPEYTLISDGSVRFTLETGETAYAACGFKNISFETDNGTYSVKGIKNRGASICCLSTHADGSSSADFSDVLDFGEHPITSVTVENMYTEKSGTGVKLYTEIKAASPTGDGLMDNMAINDDDFEIAVAKLINDEYRFTIVKEYDTADIVIDGFAVIIGGLEDVPVYVNTKLLTDNFVNRESRGNIQKVYKNGFVFIELYDSGYFTVTNFISSLFIPSIEKAYRYEGDSLILEYNDGSELYFDVAYDENVQDNKLIYNGSLSHVTDELSRYLVGFGDGEVFLPDEEWLEIAKAGVRQTVYRSAVDCTNVEMAYSRDFRTIYLFKNGDFDVHDSSRENDSDEGIDGSYKIDGETLTLNFTDGAALCFDMISSAMDVIDPELVKEFDMCRYKLVYNKEKSGISEGQTGDIPEFYHGEVFDYDEGFIELKKKAKENGEKYRREQEAKEEEIRRKLEEAQKRAEELRRLEEEERKRAEEALKSSYPALQYPTVGGISKGYSIGDNFHHGVDFAASKGTEVYAASSGEVTEIGSGWNGGYGNSVTIRHVGTMETVYAHMDEVLVKEGDEVNAGDLIGYSGSTGDAVGDELHFEVRIDGQFVDPMEYIPPVLSYPTTGGIYRKYGEVGSKGIDFDAPTGTPVYASADGTVAEIGSGWNSGYGNSVTINHCGSMETIYAHMKEILVKEGDEIKKGDLIGYSGTTGDTAYQTLFFGVRINGSYVDPMDYLGLRHFDGDKYGNP